VFGFGAIVSRLASIVLLPLYTRHLTPSDYGVVAIIDLVVNLAALVAGAGIAGAAVREHCAGDSPRHHDRVWWTALLFVGLTAALAFLGVFLARDAVAAVAFGAEVLRGPEYLTIALSALWVGTVMSTLESYHRTVKASTFLVVVSFGRLLFNVALNVWFVVVLQLGVSGILWGNLITTVVTCIVYLHPVHSGTPCCHRRHGTPGSVLEVRLAAGGLRAALRVHARSRSLPAAGLREPSRRRAVLGRLPDRPGCEHAGHRPVCCRLGRAWCTRLPGGRMPRRCTPRSSGTSCAVSASCCSGRRCSPGP
jgi:hypothetical protein